MFTRLNIGKIALTNSELIKALFLNRSNFAGKSTDSLRLRQQEIASEWDKIEYTLQSDEFWLFLHDKGYDRPTRIDFIFDLICSRNALNIENSIKRMKRERLLVLTNTGHSDTFMNTLSPHTKMGIMTKKPNYRKQKELGR